MKNFDTRTYSVSDFAEWHGNGALILSPDFQRRAVWTTKAKSYLLDTVLRGKPMPKVIITQELIDGRTVRTVVDGQQRLRAILEYMDNGFAVQKTHNEDFGGSFYGDLPPAVRDDLLQYEIGVDVLFNPNLPDLLDIFSRLNTYSVKLNSTELLNASYLGEFKTAAHRLGHRYAAYWLKAGVVTNTQLSRMAEVELAADLLGALLSGITSKKQLPNFYKRFDDEAVLVQEAADAFDRTMSFIGDTYEPSDLAHTNYRRVHLFYSMFLSLSEQLNGRPLISDVLPVEHLSPRHARVVLDDISATFDIVTQQKQGDAPSISDDWSDFVDAMRRATTDREARERRSRFISTRLSRVSR